MLFLRLGTQEGIMVKFAPGRVTSPSGPAASESAAAQILAGRRGRFHGPGHKWPSAEPEIICRNRPPRQLHSGVTGSKPGLCHGAQDTVTLTASLGTPRWERYL